MRQRRRGIVKVSDHALLRFLERAGGVNVEGFRSTIECAMARAVNAADAIGEREYRIVADGLTYIVRDNVIVTVLGERMVDTEPLRPSAPQAPR